MMKEGIEIIDIGPDFSRKEFGEEIQVHSIIWNVLKSKDIVTTRRYLNVMGVFLEELKILIDSGGILMDKKKK